MSELKKGDIVEVINDSNGDVVAGAIGRINSPTGHSSTINVEFTDHKSWWVSTRTLKKLNSSRLFPRKITSTQG